MAENPRLDALMARFAQHDRTALARLITLVENRAPEVSAVMERIYSHTGNAQIVGITGPPGAGKSTLINRLIANYRAEGKHIAVLPIDPSSPFSGGAVLGDRVRMTDHFRDPGVYIRSLSTRGSHGGLSRAAREIVRVLDAFGHDLIIVETVGVGQTELSVMDLAHTTVVVTVPEGGDGIQAMKAGLNEIADIFVVNKADREGADRLKAELELSVHLRPPADGTARCCSRRPPPARASTRWSRRSRSITPGSTRIAIPRARASGASASSLEVLTAELEELAARALGNGAAGNMLGQVREGRLNPYSAARTMRLGDRETFVGPAARNPRWP